MCIILSHLLVLMVYNNVTKCDYIIRQSINIMKFSVKHILVKVLIAGKLLYNIYMNEESTNICFNPNKESIY